MKIEGRKREKEKTGLHPCVKSQRKRGMMTMTSR